MKSVLILLFALLVISSVSFAQEEMTVEQWQAEIQKLTEEKTNLTSEFEALKAEIEALRAENSSLPSYDDCMKDFYSLLSENENNIITEDDINDFRARVAALEGKINRKEGPKADRQAELNLLKENKLSAHPDFFDKVHVELQRKLDAWVEAPTEINYTVVRGDHLWGIAKKSEHYGNPFAWPMIYRANKDQIKNPDLIYPNQVFTVPQLTEEEKMKYDKIRSNYKPAPAAN